MIQLNDPKPLEQKNYELLLCISTNTTKNKSVREAFSVFITTQLHKISTDSPSQGSPEIML